MNENEKKLIELRTELIFYKKLDEKISLVINGEISLREWSDEVKHKLSVVLDSKMNSLLDSIFTGNSDNNIENKMPTKAEIINDLLSPKQAWELLKIKKTKFYMLVESGNIVLHRFEYYGRKTFVRKSEILNLIPL